MTRSPTGQLRILASQGWGFPSSSGWLSQADTGRENHCHRRDSGSKVSPFVATYESILPEYREGTYGMPLKLEILYFLGREKRK